MRRSEPRPAVYPNRSGQAVVPLLEYCPGCATPLTGEKCKVVCRTAGCELFGRIIENCAGD